MTLLAARFVTHRFSGLTAVADFNLALEPNELVEIIGPNGAGKTTVFNLITGVYAASDGPAGYAEPLGLRGGTGQEPALRPLAASGDHPDPARRG